MFLLSRFSYKTTQTCYFTILKPSSSSFSLLGKVNVYSLGQSGSIMLHWGGGEEKKDKVGKYPKRQNIKLVLNEFIAGRWLGGWHGR